jgi:hypothetical protein
MKYQHDENDVTDINQHLTCVQRQHKAMRLRESLEHLCVDVGNGEMQPALAVAGEKFAELLSAVNAVGKSGTLTIKLKVAPLGEDECGCVDVSAQVDVKLPRAEQCTAMWIDGKMLAPPKQAAIPIAGIVHGGE